MSINPESAMAAIGMIEDGFIFEEFAQSFLSQVLTYNFTSVGGVKDRGIDGLEHVINRENQERHIYQISIEKNPKYKLSRTLFDLKENEVEF